jgi:hypothetical protein
LEIGWNICGNRRDNIITVVTLDGELTTLREDMMIVVVVFNVVG